MLPYNHAVAAPFPPVRLAGTTTPDALSALLSYLAVPLVATAVSAGVILLVRRAPLARLFADIPNERSLHSVPVPRVGGVGIMASLLAGAGFLGWGSLMPVVAIALALAVVSAIDDARGLPAGTRFLAHFGAAAALLLVYFPEWPWWFLALALVTLVWVTNLYNFMDGSDGLAGGMTTIGFGVYAIAAFVAGSAGLGVLCASLAGAGIGFLVFNFPPARVFLGDAGSIPLGFLAAALGAIGFAADTWPVWFPAVVFSPFIADASVTLIRRLARRERVWQAHKTHYYQRLIRLGNSHRRVALGAYALMGSVGAIALAATNATVPMQAFAVAGTLCLYAFLFLSVDRAWRRRDEAPAP